MNNDDVNKLVYGNMLDIKNVTEVVKQLWFLSGRYSFILNDLRKTNPLEADMQQQQYVTPATNALMPYIPYLVRTYPSAWSEELRKLYGANQ